LIFNRVKNHYSYFMTNPIQPGEDSSFKALRSYKEFIRFWFARLSGTTANQMLMVALGWHMYELTHSAWDLGLVGLFQFVPALLLFLPAGHWIDRLRRSYIFTACLAVQAGVAALLLMATTGVGASQPWVTRELILAVSIVLGSVRSFQSATQQAISPTLVPAHILSRAVAFTSGGNQLAVIGGPAIGGLLYAFDPGVVYCVCFALFTGAVVLGLTIKDTTPTPSKEPTTLKTITAGIRFIWNNKIVLGATSLDLFAVLLGGATALLPIYAKDILNAGPVELGILRAAPALGALVMTLILTRWPLQRHAGQRMLGAVAIFGLATAVFGLSHSLWLSILALMVTGIADSISVVIRMTLIQLETPNEMRGRVSAVNGIFIGASNQLGEFESGASAALLGPQASVVLGGLGSVLIALIWKYQFRELNERDQLAPK
jgi:MFS family permease